MKEYPYQRYMRDARINMIFEGTNEILRMFTTLAGVQERGEYLKKIGGALKDPIKGFGLLTDYATQWVKGKVSSEKIRDVHPSLAKAKVHFEDWSNNFRFAIERLLMHYGKNIIYKEMVQARVANAAIDLYAMISTISRVDTLIADRGEERCKREILLCNTFAEQAWRRIRRNLLMIDNNNDKKIKEISEFIVEEMKYPFETDN